jgi:gliding motility-associated-like protein
VYIFNRYGQQLYNAGGFTGPWDGSYKGKTLEPATYYYIIDTGDGQKFTGYVVLLR